VCETSAHTPIYGDRALLFEAIGNLVDNAIKFVEQGEGDEQHAGGQPAGMANAPSGGQVRVELTQTPDGPRLDIIDNGPGIALKEPQAVLQPFYPSEQTMHIEGAGLGLRIVVAVLRLHDFTLRIGNAEHRDSATPLARDWTPRTSSVSRSPASDKSARTNKR